MYIDHNKIHGCHDIHNQIQSLHHFVQGIIGSLSPANHHGALTQGTFGYLTLEAVNDKGNPLVHDFVQIGRDTRHLRHHANLKPEKKFLSVKVMRRRMCLKKNHSPTTGDPSYDGNGGNHFSGGHATAPPLGSTTDLRPGFGESL